MAATATTTTKRQRQCPVFQPPCYGPAWWWYNAELDRIEIRGSVEPDDPRRPGPKDYYFVGFRETHQEEFVPITLDDPQLVVNCSLWAFRPVVAEDGPALLPQNQLDENPQGVVDVLVKL